MKILRTGYIAHRDELCLGSRRDLFNAFTSGGREASIWNNVGLVGDHHHLLVCKEWTNRLEELQLLLQRVAALLGYVQKVQYAALEMGESSDSLHLDSITLL